MTAKQNDSVVDALNAFQIELPSWGFANTGTRFGKFLQAGAAATLEEKFSDAGQVHRWTGGLSYRGAAPVMGSARGGRPRPRGSPMFHGGNGAQLHCRKRR